MLLQPFDNYEQLLDRRKNFILIDYKNNTHSMPALSKGGFFILWKNKKSHESE